MEQPHRLRFTPTEGMGMKAKVPDRPTPYGILADEGSLTLRLLRTARECRAPILLVSSQGSERDRLSEMVDALALRVVEWPDSEESVQKVFAMLQGK